MYILYITTFITMVLLAHLSILTLFSGSRRMVNKIFAFLMACLFLWVFTNFMANLFRYSEAVLYWDKAAIIGPAFIPSLILHFTYLFPTEKKISKLKLFVIYLPAIIITFLSPTSYNVEYLIKQNDIYIMKPGLLYKLIFLDVIILVSWAMKNLYKRYKENKARERLQVLYVAIGVASAFILGIFTNLIMVLAGHMEYARYGYIGALILYVFIHQAISKHRLMGIRFIASKIYAYLFSTLVTTLFLYAVIIILSNFEKSYVVISMAACAFISYLFVIFMKYYAVFIRQSSDIIFYNSKNPIWATQDAAFKILKQKNIKDLHFEVFRQFNRIVATDDMTVLVLVSSIEKWGVVASPILSFNYLNLKSFANIMSFFKHNKSIVYIYELPEESVIRKELEKNKMKVMFPIYKGNKIIGIVMLKEKKKGLAYTREDLIFINSLISYLYNAYDKALKVLSIDNKIKENELLHKTFAEVVSHQVLTPSNIIKKLIVKSRDAANGGGVDESSLRSALKKTEKLNRVVRKFLLASVIDDEKFTFTLRGLNICEFVKMFTEKIIDKSGQKIEVECENNAKTLKVLTNETYLYEVLSEIISNAMVYSNEQDIRIAISGDYKNKIAVIRVCDRGIGIPEESMPEIFKKFYQANNAARYNQDGIGIGLYIANRIVSLHEKGRLYIEKSTRGGGTVIAIELPLELV